MVERPVARDSNNNNKNKIKIIIIGTNNSNVVAQYYVVVRTQTADQHTVTASEIPRSWIIQIV